jgi:hypothetical protein
MIRHILGVVGTLTLVTACAGTPEVQTGDNAEVIGDNLHKVDNSKADMAYIDPNVDFSKYNKILLIPLAVDHVEIKQPSSSGSMYRTKNRKWELTDADKVKLQKAFHDAMVKQFADKGGYPIVTEPGDDVMTIHGSLLGIAPSSPKDDNLSRGTGRTTTYSEGAGSMAVMVALGDSESGEVLGIMKDSRASASYWGRNNSVSNWSDVRNMFNSWAMLIRKALDEVHAKG